MSIQHELSAILYTAATRTRVTQRQNMEHEHQKAAEMSRLFHPLLTALDDMRQRGVTYAGGDFWYETVMAPVPNDILHPVRFIRIRIGYQHDNGRSVLFDIEPAEPSVYGDCVAIDPSGPHRSLFAEILHRNSIEYSGLTRCIQVDVRPVSSLQKCMAEWIAETGPLCHKPDQPTVEAKEVVEKQARWWWPFSRRQHKTA